jgi:hypothetical protein
MRINKLPNARLNQISACQRDAGFALLEAVNAFYFDDDSQRREYLQAERLKWKCISMLCYNKCGLILSLFIEAIKMIMI